MSDDIKACQVPDDQLTPEELAERKKLEAYHKRESEYSNSWEKNEQAGFGSPKCRQPTSETDFSNLKMHLYHWDFQIKGVEYDVYHIPGYPHGIDNCLYFCPKGETPNANNLKPFDKRWNPVDWSFEIHETKSWKYKWDEIRTNSGWVGYLKRNGKVFYKTFGSDQHGVWVRLQVALSDAEMHPLNFFERDWEMKAIGRKIWYHEKPCIISSINDYDGIELRIVGDNPQKRIEAPATWDGDKDDICSKQRWEENYSEGCNVEWNSHDINWFRNG